MAKIKGFRINGQIKSSEVVVIDEQGKRLGTMKTYEALGLAREKTLDLVEVSPNLTPPTCKIMDYGKHLYAVAKQKRQQSARQKKIEIKGIRLSIRTEKHDLEFKARNAVKFMKKGNKVKIDMILKGREKSHADLAHEKLDKFMQMINDISKSNSETEKQSIKKEDMRKTPQGFVAIIEYKKN